MPRSLTNVAAVAQPDSVLVHSAFWHQQDCGVHQHQRPKKKKNTPMKTNWFWLAAVVTLAFSACPAANVPCETGDEVSCDAGTPPPDLCNSKEEALSSASCQLALGMAKEGFLSTLSDKSRDRDWYSVKMPGNLTARSLLQVRAGYSVPQTAVNFAVNVQRVDGSSVVSGIDKRVGAAAPRPVELILPFSESNAQLLLLVNDDGTTAQIKVDNRNPYSVLVNVLDNPDANEPNDVTATPIALADDQNQTKRGTQTGYLATNNDIDNFSFDVTGSKQIIYFRIFQSMPAMQLNPPLNYRLAYTLFDPDGKPVAEGDMANEFLPVDLANAKLAEKPGKYKLTIQGYRSPNTPNEVVRGDLRLQYNVEVRTLPDIDTTEPNDSKTTAKAVSLALNSPQTLTGRLSYVPDAEWFKVQLAPSNSPTVLRYAVRPTATGGRFPPLSKVPNRQFRVTKEVTLGATKSDQQLACRNNATECPKWYQEDDSKRSQVEALCNSNDPPLCLWSERSEEPKFDNLKNMIGAIPVAAHSSPIDYYLVLVDNGRGSVKYADDLEWKLDLSLVADSDEAGRGAAPQAANLSSSGSTVSGELTFGHGRIIEGFDLNNGEGIRGPTDYDAVVTDTDAYQFNISPASNAALGWSLEWDLDNNSDGGVPAGELALEISFCSGTGASDAGAFCPGRRQTLAYKGGGTKPWYSSTGNIEQFKVSKSAASSTVTLLPASCSCIPNATAASGQLFINVVGGNRVGNEPIRYRLKQSVGNYPYSYTGGAMGMPGVCPASDAGGGCGFADPP